MNCMGIYVLHVMYMQSYSPSCLFAAFLDVVFETLSIVYNSMQLMKATTV